MANRSDFTSMNTKKPGPWNLKPPGKLTRRIILLFGGMLTIALFFMVPPHKEWLKERIVQYWIDFLAQRDQQDLEQRKVKRFRSHYTLSKHIADLLAKKGDKKSAWVLLPPTGYFKRNGIDYEVPDPGVFYYFTDIKTVSANNVQAIEANWYVRVYNKQIIIDSVTSRNNLKDSINYFRSIK